MALAACFRSFIMEPSTLSALTKTSNSLGVLQHLTMTLTACGDTVLVRNHFTVGLKGHCHGLTWAEAFTLADLKKFSL